MAPRYVDFEGTEFATVVAKYPAPTAGAVFNLWSDNPAIASVPASVTVPANEQEAEFTVTWVDVGTTIIHAQLASAGGYPFDDTIFDLDIECLDIVFETVDVYGVEASVEVQDIPIEVAALDVQSGLEELEIIVEALPLTVSAQVDDDLEVSAQVISGDVEVSATVCEDN